MLEIEDLLTVLLLVVNYLGKIRLSPYSSENLASSFSLLHLGYISICNIFWFQSLSRFSFGTGPKAIYVYLHSIYLQRNRYHSFLSHPFNQIWTTKGTTRNNYVFNAISLSMSILFRRFLPPSFPIPTWYSRWVFRLDQRRSKLSEHMASSMYACYFQDLWTTRRLRVPQDYPLIRVTIFSPFCCLHKKHYEGQPPQCGLSRKSIIIKHQFPSIRR